MQIRESSFEGCRAVVCATGALELVLVSEYGPRVASLSVPGGENLLLWKPETYTRGAWDLRGGHRVWVTRPRADENEDTYAVDNEPCDVAIAGNAVTVTGALNAANATRRGITVTAVDEETVKVDNFVTNGGDMLYSGGVWALTCTVPGAETEYAVPVGDGSSWDAFTMVHFREWGGHGQGGFGDDQIAVTDDLVRVRPRGVENKRMVQSHHGIIAMCDPGRGVTFAKQALFQPAGQYPLNTNIAFYIGPENFMVEMETMGPEATLKPGGTLHHEEVWKLTQPVALDTAGSLVKLFE